MATRREIIYRRRRIFFSIVMVLIIGCIVGLFFGIKAIANSSAEASGTPEESVPMANPAQVTKEPETTPPPEIPKADSDYPEADDKTVTILSESIDSEYAVLLDIENNRVVARKGATSKINPASLTKVMTILVAAENIEDFDDTFTMTYEIIAPLIKADATRAGFSEGEECKLIDLMYGAVLPSGADCTIALAEYISGSEEEFVKLMNKKASDLGLKNTHFENTSGLYGDNHYSTPLDLAVIMKAAIQNDLCRKILSTYQYTTAASEQDPEGIDLESTMFSRMYGNEVEGVQILGGKTGYIYESGHCLVSFAQQDEKEYICVTINGKGRYKPIYDCFTIYESYLNKNEADGTTSKGN